jgi:AcrR family transcriptional regulator
MGRPPLTSRERILVGARLIIDRDGWEKLTIRRLAVELEIAPATLYHHIQDKEDLLLQLLNQHADQTLPQHLPSQPRDRIIAAATAMHDSLAAWPWAAEVLTADGFLGRLGTAALRMVEGIVSGVVDHGCTAEQGVQVFRSIWYYTAGEILVRAHSGGHPSNGWPPAPNDVLFEHIDASQLPHLAGIRTRWQTLAARDTYTEALQAFVDGLLVQAAAKTSP